MGGGYTLSRTPPRQQAPRGARPGGTLTPPPCMAGYCSFALPCMMTEPNGLVLKIFSKPDQIWNMCWIWAKNKKNHKGEGHVKGRIKKARHWSRMRQCRRWVGVRVALASKPWRRAVWRHQVKKKEVKRKEKRRTKFCVISGMVSNFS